MKDYEVNGSGVRDPVAAEAIKAADKPSDRYNTAVRRMKIIAGWHDFEVVGQIELRDKRTGRRWP